MSNANRPTIDAVVHRATEHAINSCLAQGVIKLGQFPNDRERHLISIGILAAIEAMAEVAAEKARDDIMVKNAKEVEDAQQSQTFFGDLVGGKVPMPSSDYSKPIECPTCGHSR